MFDRLSKFTALLVLLTWAFVPLSLPAQIVLCYGTDGHVAVEAPHGLCDTGKSGERSTDTGAASLAIVGQPDCTDVPVAPVAQWPRAQVTQERSGASSLPLDFAFASLAGDHPNRTMSRGAALAASSPVHPSPELLRLRSVILLV